MNTASLNTINKMTKTDFQNFVGNIPNTIPESDLFNGIFMYNNYSDIISATYKLTGDKFSQSDNLFDFKKLEKLNIEEYSRITGRITIDVEEDLLNNLKNTDVHNITLSDLKNLPFKAFKIDTKNFDNVNNIFIIQKNGNIYIDYSGIGKEKISIQMVFDKDKGLYPQYTMSSLFYHREISPISEETQVIAEKLTDNVISILLYLINSDKNKSTIVKTMNYNDYKSKQTDKQLSKQKVQDKLNRKNNIVTLQYNKSVKYLNSIQNQTKWKNTKKFLVRGHFRKQPIGRREEGKYYMKWIQPFFKGIESNNCIKKVYKVA